MPLKPHLIYTLQYKYFDGNRIRKVYIVYRLVRFMFMLLLLSLTRTRAYYNIIRVLRDWKPIHFYFRFTDLDLNSEGLKFQFRVCIGYLSTGFRFFSGNSLDFEYQFSFLCTGFQFFNTSILVWILKNVGFKPCIILLYASPAVTLSMQWRNKIIQSSSRIYIYTSGSRK